ncbi:MAG: hypothetical protein KA436_04750 [Oligoflexales bacterium]|nr:hypothetical protein [Oligoflexales bacterium]
MKIVMSTLLALGLSIALHRCGSAPTEKVAARSSSTDTNSDSGTDTATNTDTSTTGGQDNTGSQSSGSSGTSSSQVSFTAVNTILSKNCGSCHGSSGRRPRFVGSESATVSAKNEIYNAVNSGSMPPSGEMSSGDTQTILNYCNQ